MRVCESRVREVCEVKVCELGVREVCEVRVCEVCEQCRRGVEATRRYCCCR